MSQVEHPQMDEVSDLARNGAEPVIGKVQPFELGMCPKALWYPAQSFVIQIQGLQWSLVNEWIHAVFAFDLFTDFVINSSRTFMSTSSSLLIYKQPLPVLYFPSRFKTSLSNPPIM